MAVLKVVLADLVAEAGPNRSDSVQFPAPIRSTLQGLFDRVLGARGGNSGSGFTSVEVGWWSLSFRGGNRSGRGPAGMAPPLAPHDLIVYFVREPSDSVLVHMPGVTTGPVSGLTGFTAYSSTLTASEVYTHGHQYNPVGLATVAFHELMHFASHLGNAALHGMRSFNGQDMNLSADEVFAETEMGVGDAAFMAHHLPRTNRQPWTGGYSAYIDPANGHI